MKFININTGAILEPSCEMVTAQLRKNPLYREYIPQVKKEPSPVKEKPPVEYKSLSKMKKDELLAVAQEAGLEVPGDATKDQIVKMINAARGE